MRRWRPRSSTDTAWCSPRVATSSVKRRWPRCSQVREGTRRSPQSCCTCVPHTHVNLDLDSRFVVVATGLATGSTEGTVLVANSLGAADHAVDLVALALVLAVPMLMLLVGFLVWWFMGRSLRPVELIRAEVAELSATDLSRRVSEPPTFDEIGRLARTMNAMLARLEYSNARQRQLVADVSHELRNPLASMRTQLEVAVAHPGPENIDLVQGAIAEVTRTTQLVEDLLTLARFDERSAPVRLGEVDLDDVVFDVVDTVRALGAVEVSALARRGCADSGRRRAATASRDEPRDECRAPRAHQSRLRTPRSRGVRLPERQRRRSRDTGVRARARLRALRSSRRCSRLPRWRSRPRPCDRSRDRERARRSWSGSRTRIRERGSWCDYLASPYPMDDAHEDLDRETKPTSKPRRHRAPRSPRLSMSRSAQRETRTSRRRGRNRSVEGAISRLLGVHSDRSVEGCVRLLRRR